MRILIYGAGVIGSIFAGKLLEAGYEVAMLARGKRYDELTANGLILIDSLTSKKYIYKIPVISNLSIDDIYDYIIVTVQKTQIDDILPILAINKSPNIVFVVNNPSGYDDYIKSVGYNRIIIGFPSAGGERKNGKVSYFIGTGLAKIFQATTFGELNGQRTERLLRLIEIFRKAKFSPAICKNMDAWQKTHVAVILPIAKALYKFNSNNYKLARSYNTLAKMVIETREYFKVLKKLNYRITPRKLNFYYLPIFILVPIFMIFMNTRIAEFAMAKHTIVAKDEMMVLDSIFNELIKKSKENG